MADNVIRNGLSIADNREKILHAHGGFIVKHDKEYYWFGENRLGDIRVSCYKSEDLINWEYRNDVLTLKSSVGDHYIRSDKRMIQEIADSEGILKTVGCNIERPKVLYNKKTQKYVMWMHYENGIHYGKACCAVAICDTIDGDYTYLGAFNPVGNMSRDCTVFVEEDGAAYFLSAARENQDLILYRLTQDYLAIEEQVKIYWPGQCREAPALFKKDGYYYLLTSACTGWAPNQGKYAVTSSLLDGFGTMKTFGNGTTYDSQPAFVLPIQGYEGTEYLYVGDRWNGTQYHESTYVFLPLTFDEQGNMTMNYYDNISIDLKKGRITVNDVTEKCNNI